MPCGVVRGKRRGAEDPLAPDAPQPGMTMIRHRDYRFMTASLTAAALHAQLRVLMLPVDDVCFAQSTQIASGWM